MCLSPLSLKCLLHPVRRHSIVDSSTVYYGLSYMINTWRSQIDVRAEPEEVLETLTDIDACKAWSPVAFDVGELECGRLRAGTKVPVSGAIAGRRVRFCVEILRADSERLLLRAAGPVEMHADYLVRPANGGSRLHAAVSLRRGTGGGGRLAARATSILLATGVLNHALGRIAREAERRQELGAQA